MRFRKISAPSQPQRLKQTLANLRRALEELETALVEFEEAIDGESTTRPDGRKGLNLLSIPEICQELGMGKSWVYRRLRSGEIASAKRGRSIKVKREDLEEYLENNASDYQGNKVSLLPHHLEPAFEIPGIAPGLHAPFAQGAQITN